MKVEIILSIVLAACTVVYTVINLFMLLESRATRKQKITPLIVPFLKSAENHIAMELHIKNIGEGIAKNVRINVIKDYKRFGKENLLLSEIESFKNIIHTFPPEYELKYYIHSMSDIYENDKDEYIQLEFCYESSDNRSFRETFKLSFSQVLGQNYSNPPETYIGQISYYLKKIDSSFEKIEKSIKVFSANKK
jgi:hypothetical protein